MTDKQIIIDGVDVSGCDASQFNFDGCFYECKIKGFYNNCFYIDCEDNPNCYYKQLKRKEQECKELKKNVEHWKMEHKEAKAKGEWTHDLVKKRLGQQLDQLKGENVGALKQLEFVRTLNAVQEAEIRKLKQTLTEIKEIAEENFYFLDCDYRWILEKILQKISESEGNNE